MSKKNRTISINYTSDEIEQLLLNRFKDPEDKHIAEAIVGYLSKDDFATSGLVKAILGIKPVFKYQEGDMVWIDFSDVPSWKCDKDQTKTLPSYKYAESPALYRDGLLLAQIESINPFELCSYTVSFNCMEKGKLMNVTYSFLERVLVCKEESFLDILDEMAKKFPGGPDGEELPF